MTQSLSTMDAVTERIESPPLVQVRSVCKTFRAMAGAVAALVDVSLDVKASEFFTLLGPSGCGKTTLLRMIAGFEHPESGTILLDDRPVLQDPPNKRPVNIVFQSYALFPHLSVAQNVAFGLARKGRRGPSMAARVAAMLDLVRLGDLAERRPHQLSGGQQQRVALARALAPEPKLLLLDEPLSALDRELRHGMQRELKRIQRETGIAFLLVTHDQEEALSLSDRIAVMAAGRVLQVGRPDAIFDRPASRFVAEFMGSNVLPGRLVGVAAPHVAIRPEHIAVLPDAGLAPEPSAFALAGCLEAVTYRGARTACLVVLEAGGTLASEQRDGLSALRPGQRVVCRFRADALVALAS